MITKEQGNTLTDFLQESRKIVSATFDKVSEKFTELLKDNGEFAPHDYDLNYGGFESPINCNVVKIYYSDACETIICDLHDTEYDSDYVFDAPITDIDLNDMLNLFGQAVNYFAEK